MMLKAVNFGTNHKKLSGVLGYGVSKYRPTSRVLFGKLKKVIDLCVFLFVCLLECFDCGVELLDLCCENGDVVFWA